MHIHEMPFRLNVMSVEDLYVCVPALCVRDSVEDGCVIITPGSLIVDMVVSTLVEKK